MKPADSVNPYIPPEEIGGVSANAPARRFTLLGVLAMIFLAALLGAVVTSRLRLMRWLAEFEVELPAISAIAFSPLLPGIVGVGLLAVLVKEFAWRDRRAIASCNLLAVVLGLVALAVYVLGAVWPMISLIEALAR